MKRLFPLIILLAAALHAQEATSSTSTQAPQEQQADKISLSPILMFVADKNTAEAAAPRIRRLIGNRDPRSVNIDINDLILLRSTACFGSETLREVMAPFIPTPSEEELSMLEPHLELLENLWQAMDDMTSSLQTVTDKPSADAAADMLESFTAYVASISDKIAELSPPIEPMVSAELRLRYISGTRMCTSRFLQSWGVLAAQSPEYYGSERLIESLLSVRDVLENMDMQIDPEAIPHVMTIVRELRPLMRQWIAVISLVRDRNSADAAAIQLHRINTRMRDVAMQSGLSRSFEEDIFLFSPELEMLVHIMDRISHHLADEVKPPFYGSQRLQEALEHED